MDNFDHILNWKLERGSHAVPGQDGGTCINEAAIVAAGFPYRPAVPTGPVRAGHAGVFLAPDLRAGDAAQ